MRCVPINNRAPGQGAPLPFINPVASGRHRVSNPVPPTLEADAQPLCYRRGGSVGVKCSISISSKCYKGFKNREKLTTLKLSATFQRGQQRDSNHCRTSYEANTLPLGHWNGTVNSVFKLGCILSPHKLKQMLRFHI